MASLVSDFIINPVLRQARRFSRAGSEGSAIATTAATDVVDPVTNRHTTVEQLEQEAQEQEEKNEIELEEPNRHIHRAAPTTTTAAEVNTDIVMEGQDNGSAQGLTDRPMVSSPPPLEDEQTPLADLSTQYSIEVESRQSTGVSFFNPPTNTTHSDNDLSDNPNPSFGVPERFQNESPVLRRPTTDSPGRGGPERQTSSTLHEDDGMRALRRKIVQIQTSTASPGEKAKQMHELLTEGYTKSQIREQVKAAPPVEAELPSNLTTQIRPATPTSGSYNFWNSSPPGKQATEFHLAQSDLARSYAPLPEDKKDDNILLEDRPLGCEHYKRNVKLQCFTCQKWYPCRLCHDAVENHQLPRRETKNMLCMLCGTAQKAGSVCANECCGARAANYYCAICHLWEDDPNRSIYHCADCGICRVGRGLGRDFFHCKTCGLCMNISLQGSHRCIEKSTQACCPICAEWMFESTEAVVFMRCGHTIHRHCYHEHMQRSYKCPICQQTVVNMESQFRGLDRAIEAQPMPEGFRDMRVLVSCTDCRAKSISPYHWLGLKCGVCHGYNTRQIAIINQENQLDETTEAPQIPDQEDGAAGMEIPGVRPGVRRHSSHARQFLHPNAANSGQHFDPYVDSRLGRSASPTRGDYFRDESTTAVADDGDEVWDDSELDWLGRSRRELGQEEEEDEESSSDEDMEEEEEEEDEMDAIQLFGHR